MSAIHMETMAQQAAKSTIHLVKDFSKEPFGRFPSDGPNSGERFRKEFLVPAIRSGGQVCVDLSGAYYGSSFLEEAFGGLVREEGFELALLRERLHVVHTLRSYPALCWKYIESAASSIGDYHG